MSHSYVPPYPAAEDNLPSRAARINHPDRHFLILEKDRDDRWWRERGGGYTSNRNQAYCYRTSQLPDGSDIHVELLPLIGDPAAEMDVSDFFKEEAPLTEEATPGQVLFHALKNNPVELDNWSTPEAIRNRIRTLLNSHYQNAIAQLDEETIPYGTIALASLVIHGENRVSNHDEQVQLNRMLIEVGQRIQALLKQAQSPATKKLGVAVQKSMNDIGY